LIEGSATIFNEEGPERKILQSSGECLPGEEEKVQYEPRFSRELHQCDHQHILKEKQKFYFQFFSKVGSVIAYKSLFLINQQQPEL